MDMTHFKGKQVIVRTVDGRLPCIGEFDIISDGNGGAYRIETKLGYIYINPEFITSVEVDKEPIPEAPETQRDLFGKDTWVVKDAYQAKREAFGQ